MKKIIFIISLSILVYTGYTYGGNFLKIFQSPTAYAVGDLTVNWGVPVGNPIFTISNAAPGFSQTKTVQVNNGASSSRPIGIKGVKNTESKNLANALFIVISKNGTDLYGGTTGTKTLSQFFTDTNNPSGITLSTLAANASTTYSIKLIFNPQAGNEFQQGSISFNLLMGVTFDIPVACQTMQFNGPTIFGTSGNDKIVGTNKSEMIVTFEGNDKIDGAQGNDCIVAGAGADTVDGGLGNDVIYGGSEADTISGGNGSDTIYGEGGTDTLDGGNNDDTLHGGDDNDRLDGGNDSDHLFGENGSDTLLGGNSSDNLDGGAGIDSADGQNGQDTCIAESKLRCEL